MGAVHSRVDQDPKDDSTERTRTTKSTATTRSSSSYRSPRPQSSLQQEGVLRDRIALPRLSKKKISSRTKPKSGSVFALHGIAIESFDTGIFIGSLTMGDNNNNNKNHNFMQRSSTNRAAQPLAIIEPQSASLSTTMHAASLNSARVDYYDAESLPRPMHETELKVAEYIQQHSAARPVRCPNASPTTAIAHSAGDMDYLSMVYNLRTRNMYKLIKRTRENNDEMAPPPRHRVSFGPTVTGRQQRPRAISTSEPIHHHQHPDMVFQMDMD